MPAMYTLYIYIHIVIYIYTVYNIYILIYKHMIPGQSKMGKTSMGFPDNDLRDVWKPKRVPGEGDQQSPEMGHLHTLRVSGSVASEFAVYII